MLQFMEKFLPKKQSIKLKNMEITKNCFRSFFICQMCSVHFSSGSSDSSIKIMLVTSTFVDNRLNGIFGAIEPTCKTNSNIIQQTSPHLPVAPLLNLIGQMAIETPGRTINRVGDFWTKHFVVAINSM